MGTGRRCLRLLVLAVVPVIAGPAFHGLVDPIPLPHAGSLHAQEPSIESRTTLHVSCSRNVELFSVLAHLTPHWTDIAPRGPLAVEARARFLPFVHHAAVDGTNTFLRHRSANSLLRVALHLSNFPEARILDASSSFLWRAYLARVVAPMRDFDRSSGFEQYWRDHSARVQAWSARADAALAGAPVIATLEQFFGTSRGSYHLVFAPLMDRLRTGDLWRSDAGEQAVVIFGPRDGVQPDAAIDVRTLVVDIAWLEFCRVWVTDLVERNLPRLRQHASLQTRALRLERHSGPAKPWQGFWIDNLTAGVHARLVARVYGQAAGADVLARLHADDIMARDVYAALDAYEADRGRYPTLQTFLTELIARLESHLPGGH